MKGMNAEKATKLEPIVRTDTELGVREEAEFFQSANQWLFGFRHLPLGKARGGVLICSPLLAELGKNYRREFELGRRLAMDGFAVQRFHYRGTGNSGGEDSEVTLDSLQQDAMSAGVRLRQASGASVSAVVGTRLGAFVAAGVAHQSEVRALALWNPLLEGSRPFREAYRARLFRDLRQGTATSRSRDALSRELSSRGRVDVLGYTIHRNLYESLAGRELEEELKSPPRFVLLLQIGGGAHEAASHQGFANRLIGRGAAVDIEMIDREEPWWFGEREEEGSVATPTITDSVERTHEWLRRVLTQEEGP